MRCPHCGSGNPPEKRFCGDCGAGLAADPRAALRRPDSQEPNAAIATALDPGQGERKTVTTLVADIQGSMALLEKLDPEAARDIVDPALQLMIEAVHHYDGHVAQSTGDGIFALFGAPAAHEDHPQRALYTALRMQEALKRFSERVRAEGRPPLQVRIGVNTGLVVVRPIATRDGHTEYLPIGHSASLAARLQELAPPGSIATTRAVRELCEGYFVFEDLGRARIKGASEPVQVFEVTGVGTRRTRLQRGDGHGLTKFVGRHAELEALRSAAGCAQQGRGQIVAVVADPGVGKSRLLFEFRSDAGSGWTTLETSSVSHAKASPLQPVVDLLRSYFGVVSGADARESRETVAARLVTLDSSLEASLPNLFSLLGIADGPDALALMDVRVRQRRLFDAIERVLLRESLEQPLMILFEDLQWIDAETQTFLDRFVDSIGMARILLMVSHRPQYTRAWGSKRYYTRLWLKPLPNEGAEEMLASLLGDAPDLVDLKRLIIERTDGNPFFMEEMVRVLLDEGALVRPASLPGQESPPKLARPVGALSIPSTVEAVLASRIDRLPPGEKDLLQTMAVIGREFAEPLLRRVVTIAPEPLEHMLADLQLGGFVYARPAYPDMEFVFQHALTQQVAHDSILAERRRAVHGRVAEAMVDLWADNLGERCAVVAHHCESSGNLPGAVEYLRYAAEHAVRVSAHGDGVAHLDAALEMLPGLPGRSDRDRVELDLRVELGPLLMATRGWSSPDVESNYERAFELCTLVDDAPRLFPTLRGLWECYQARGRLELGEELSQRLLGLAENAGQRVVAHDVCADTAFWIGDLRGAAEHAAQGIALYDEDRDRSLAFAYGGYDPGVACLCFASVASSLPDQDDYAIDKAHAALALARRLEQPFSEAFVFYFTAMLHYLRRDAVAARHAAQFGIKLCDEGGFPFYLALCTSFHGWAMAALGDAETGIAEVQQGLADYVAIGGVLERPLCLLLLADASLRVGRTDLGADALTRALHAAGELGQRTLDSELHRLRDELERVHR